VVIIFFDGGFLMDYENICKIVGQFFLETRFHISTVESKNKSLILENGEIKKQLAVLEEKNYKLEQAKD